MKFMRKLAALLVLLMVIATSQVTLAYEFREEKISSSDSVQLNPRIQGDIVVWEDYRNDPFGGYRGDGIGNPDIYAYNISSHKEFPICTQKEGDGIKNSSQQYPDVWGNYVVWEDWRNGNADIYIYDLSDPDQPANGTRLTFNPKNQIEPRIWGNYVVWIDYRNGLDGDIYGFNLSVDSNHNGIPDWKESDFDWNLANKSIFPICTYSATQKDVDIYGHIVVWKDYRSAGTEPSGPPGVGGGASVGENRDIYGYDIWKKREFKICTEEHNQFQPAIYGDIVVWGDMRTGTPSIMGINISSGEMLNFSDGHPQSHPVIYKDIVAWVEKDNNTEYIMVSKIGGKPQMLLGKNWTQRTPSISFTGKYVAIAWSDGRDVRENEYGRPETIWQVYMKRATDLPPVIENISTVPSKLEANKGYNMTIIAHINDPEGDNVSALASSPIFGNVTLFDDGKHGDGSAGDGIYGAYVHVNTSDDFQITVFAEDEYGANSSSSIAVQVGTGESPSGNSSGNNTVNPTEVLIGALAIVIVFILILVTLYIIRRKTKSEIEEEKGPKD